MATLNRNSNGWRNVLETRRALVAPLLVRHMTERQITKALMQQGERNPENNEPWTRGTIHADIAHLLASWRTIAVEGISEAKGRVLAQIREVEREAWLARNYNLLLRALKDERELLGLDAPLKADIEHTVRGVAEELGIDPDDAVREV